MTVEIRKIGTSVTSHWRLK